MNAERLRQLLSYDPETGVFTWRIARGPVVAGSAAGFPIGRYWMICVDGRDYSAHRLAWLHMHGHWPAEDVDHTNGDGLDNRAANLREATRTENCCNTRRGSRNTSGEKGVSYWSKPEKWVAEVVLHGRRVHLSKHDTFEAAVAARRAAVTAHHGQFARIA